MTSGGWGLGRWEGVGKMGLAERRPTAPAGHGSEFRARIAGAQRQRWRAVRERLLRDANAVAVAPPLRNKARRVAVECGRAAFSKIDENRWEQMRSHLRANRARHCRGSRL